MGKLNIANVEYQKIEQIDSPANNFSFDLELSMNDTKSKMTLWRVWTNKQHKSLYIEFKGENRTSVDMLELHLQRLKEFYIFDFSFVNPSTHDLFEKFTGIETNGIIYIENILCRAKAATAAGRC